MQFFDRFPLSATFGRQPINHGLPPWARRIFADPLTPHIRNAEGEVLVWAIQDDASEATITEQFKANADEYDLRYANSDHFEGLFRQALEQTGVKVSERPLILDLGSGSGANSVVPCQRLFPGARYVATDLSSELLQMLARYVRHVGALEDVVCVVMDAMGDHLAPGRFDLVTGAAILHHLDHPEQGVAAAARALKPGGHAIFFEPFTGFAVMRLAYERILAEGDLRGGMDPEIVSALEAFVTDIAARTNPDPHDFKYLDDKWVFSRSAVAAMAEAAGFASARFVPHNHHATLYRDMARITLGMKLGRDDIAMPDWAASILDGFDAALPAEAKRELMVEGTIVLTKGR